MRKNLVRKTIVLGILTLFLGINVASSTATTMENTILENTQETHHPNSTRVSEVWVDDDYYDGGDNDGHTWGYDAFDNIQQAINQVEDFSTIHVKEGIYDVFSIEDRLSLEILGEDQPIVTGNQHAYDVSYPAIVNNVIFVNNSYNINIEGFHIIGTNPQPTDRDFTVFFQNSNGELQDCTIDANSIENMYGIAVRAILESSLTLEDCLIKDYGRIAVYAKTATILSVLNCTLIGQVYTQYNLVSYGIEIEGIDTPCLGILKGNHIYNHDNTQAAAWSSAGIVIDTWRYYGPTYNCKNSSVHMENNDIYDNMHGVQIVPNGNIQLIYNTITGNRYGAISDQWYDGAEYHDEVLQAPYNWWGDPSGPYHATDNPDGQGDEIYGDILFTPWLTDIAADLTGQGTITWQDVPTGETVTGSFTLSNTGYLYSELSWEVSETPTWGDWTITPESGANLRPDMGPQTIQVTVIAPQKRNEEYTGTIKIINTENPTDYCTINITLITPVTTPAPLHLPLLQWLCERFPLVFPVLRHLLGY